MRFVAILAVLFTFAMPVLAQDPAPKADSKATLSADELEMMKDSVEQLDKAAQDMQTANLFLEAFRRVLEGAKAKQERAAILLEARKLKILNSRGLSDTTHEVAYVAGPNGQGGGWVVREKAKEKPKP